MLSVRIILLAGLIGFPLVSTVILLSLFWVFAESASERQTRALMNHLINEIADRVEIFFDRSERAALLTQRLAEADLLQTSRLDEIERYFFEQLRLNPEITGLLFGTLGGESVYVTGEAPGVPPGGFYARTIAQGAEGLTANITIRDERFHLLETPALPGHEVYDARTRPWFTDALESEAVVWTEPYVFFTSRLPGLTTSAVAYRSDGETIGVGGADVSLSDLTEFVEEQQARFPGEIALTTAQLDVIAAPGFVDADARGLDRLPSLSEAGPPSLRAAADLLLAAENNGEPGIHHHKIHSEGEDRLVAISVIDGAVSPWIIGVTVPYSEVFGWFRQVEWTTTIVALALVAVSCTTGLLLWQAVSRRLAGLRASATAVARGAYSQAVAADSRLTELRETEGALGAMAKAIEEREGQNRLLMQDLRRFAEAVHQVDQAILLTDADGTIRYVNPAMEMLTGYAGADLIGKVPSVLLGAADNRAAYEACVDAVRGGGLWRGEMALNHRSGEILPIFLIASPVKSSHGFTVNCAVVMHDMRERRRTEAALREACHQAIQTSQAKSTFLASVSHELRTPLNGIVGLSEMMSSEMFGDVGHPRYREYVQDIREAAGTLQEIIDNILELTSLEFGKTELTVDRAPVAPLLHDVRRLSLAHAERRGVDITIDCEPGVEVRLDFAKLRLMLANLAANAVKYSPPGSTVHLAADQDRGGLLRLSVTDAGPGMTPQQVAAALQPFGRSEADAQVATEAGLGLGLPMALAIAELHGATLEVHSKPGDGTTVEITFPVTSNPMVAVPTD